VELPRSTTNSFQLISRPNQLLTCL